MLRGLILVLALLCATPALAQQVPSSQAQIDLTFAPLVKRAAPAVVNIYASRRVEVGVSPFMRDPLFRRFFGDAFPNLPGRQRIENALGSGVIVSDDGLVVTNAHVIDGADDIRVALSDRREFDAEMVLVDKRTDLAVLRISGADEPLPTLSLRDSDEVEVGDLVLAIGNPFGVGQTVTSGIVSALARTEVGIADFNFFIQTDAAINPGNSGGALVDIQGSLIGINTAIYSRDGGSQGIGFAVPANMVRTVIAAAQAGGALARPWLGADGQAVDRDLADALGLDRPFGVIVETIWPDGPAERAGLRRGDVVIAVNGREVADPGALRFRVATLELDSEASLTVLREGDERRLTFRASAPPEEPPRDETVLEGSHPLNGATVINLSPAVAYELGLRGEPKGVMIAELARGAYPRRLGARVGDLVRAVNGTEVESVDQLRRLVDRRRQVWELTLERDGRLYSITVRG